MENTMKRERAKCIVDTQNGRRIPGITKGKFYQINDSKVKTISTPDDMMSVIGDDGDEIERNRNFFGNVLRDE